MHGDHTLIRKMYFYISHEPGMVLGTRDTMVSEIIRVSSLKCTDFSGADDIQ